MDNPNLFPSEFIPPKDTKEILEIFSRSGFMMGRMIGASKSDYRQKHPDDTVIFNSNIITKKWGKIWYGDVNVTKDAPALKHIAGLIGENLYILFEKDGRFGEEGRPIDELISKAQYIVNPLN